MMYMWYSLEHIKGSVKIKVHYFEKSVIKKRNPLMVMFNDSVALGESRTVTV